MTVKYTKTILVALPILLGVTLILPASSASAEDCWSWFGKCLGTQEIHSTESFSASGVKAKVTVPDMTTSGSCSPNGNGFSLVATWVLFPNGEWIEIGVASGNIDGTCYDSEEHHYMAYQQNGNYYEYKLSGSISPSDNVYYEISDTDKNMKWHAYQSGSKRAGLIMDSTYGDVIVGVESMDDDTSVPKTDVKYIQVHDGAGWSYWTYNDAEYDTNGGFITQCTPAYKNIKVGIGGSETC